MTFFNAICRIVTYHKGTENNSKMALLYNIFNAICRIVTYHKGTENNSKMALKIQIYRKKLRFKV